MTILTQQINNDDNYQEPYLSYADLGWKLIPCHGIVDGICTCGIPHTGKTDAGKHPTITDWNNASTNNPEILSQWFGDSSAKNLGVNCKESGLVVIDIDPRNGGSKSFLELECWLSGAIPQTVTAITGEYIVKGVKTRGKHLYFKANPETQFFKDLTKQGFRGIDIKSNGYVLLPPSRHASGVNYEWAPGLSPFEIEIAELTPEMETVLIKGKNTPLPASETESFNFDFDSEIVATPQAKRQLEAHVERIAKHTYEGQRNTALNDSAFQMGQYIGGGQISVNEVVEALGNAALLAFGGEDALSEIASVLRTKGGALGKGALMPIYDVNFEQIQAEAEAEVYSEDELEFLARMNIVDFEELWADDSEELWFVDGLICAERGHTIYSDPGVGKSLLVREMCACLASGKPVLGLQAKEPIKILYIDHENIPKTDIRRSLIDMGFSWEELKDNFILMSFPEFSPFDAPMGGQELKRVLEIINPNLVIMDTASRTIKGPESVNDTWIDFYNYTGKILKAKGIAYIRIDHTGKNPNAGPRGGSAKMGDVDLVWYLKEIETDKKFKLENEKHRVPLENLEFTILRHTSPLRHVLSTALDWAGLAKSDAKFQEMVKSISVFMDANPKQKDGLNSLYKAMQHICKEKKYSRREFDEARKEYLRLQIEQSDF